MLDGSLCVAVSKTSCFSRAHHTRPLGVAFLRLCVNHYEVTDNDKYVYVSPLQLWLFLILFALPLASGSPSELAPVFFQHDLNSR